MLEIASKAFLAKIVLREGPQTPPSDVAPLALVLRAVPVDPWVVP
jgi:hypothetical protein